VRGGSQRKELTVKKRVGVKIADHFSSIADPRIDRTKRHELLDIVVIAIGAVICGAGPPLIPLV
jgi:hypothetical protein